MSEEITSIDEIAAACSDCGNCLYACPVYNAELTEPNSPRGKVNLIKKLEDGGLEPNSLNREFMYQCILCGSCEHQCTRGVQFTSMMIDYRNKASKGRRIPLFKKVVLYLYQSFLFKKFTWVIDLLSRTPLRGKFTIPRRRSANLRKLMSRGNDGKTYDLLIFPGCVTGSFYPDIVRKMYRYLENNGFSVVLPRGLECCGFPYKSQGWDKKFETFRTKNKKVFSRFKYRYIVVPCGTCVMSLREHYGLEGVEIFELSQFFHRFLPDARLKPEYTAPREGGPRFTWHDPCHHLKSLGIKDAPRHYMKQMGESFVDDGSALCCGFGGIFSVGFPSTSQKITSRKAGVLKDLGAEAVVTGCPGCYLHLKESLPQDVTFFIDLFDDPPERKE